MSSLINKVKEAIHSDKSTEQPEGTHGPHSSRPANAADPRVDSDRDHRAGHSSNLTGTGDYSSTTNYTTDTHNTRGTDGPATSTDGPHKSNVMNKMDPRVDSDRDHSRNMGANPHGTSGTGAYNASDSTRIGGIGGTTGYSSRDTSLPEGTAGPHGSRMANAADPRVDSDRDGSRNMGANPHGTATTGHTGTHGIGGTTGYSSRDTSLPEGTAGPHSSRMANAADPRVDSDRDGSRHIGGNTHGTSTGTYGQTTVGGGIGGTTGTSGFASAGTGAHGPSSHSSGLPEGSTGPHNSRVANAADPRVDSDLDGSRKLGNRGAGAETTNYGSSTGTYGSSGTHGTQGTSMGGAGGAYGTGPASNTAGPHKSDMLNKADPRVDSDLDGSKTVGRDKTFERSNDFTGKDPTDAAQVPPSVLQKHVPSEIHHEHDEHDHTRRHSVSHQEKHRGL
ncbi:hypothetical protein CDV36_014951 [Fusarium kuroshium]|uniref:Period circadian protein n=1 Tax=Fusarium kuroshium TaxID=2010991 RepID=A0A3M2RE03_9HYPO|nr:hypothetical protein CDV36_014951 [Fusarium kuroshium]